VPLHTRPKDRHGHDRDPRLSLAHRDGTGGDCGPEGVRRTVQGQPPGGLGWMALRRRVEPRLWLAGAVRGPYERRLRRGLLERVSRGARQRSRVV